MDEFGATLSANSGSFSSVDRDRLLLLVDNDLDLLREIVDLFLEDAPTWVESIREAISADDSAALSAGAHALKGALGNFAADRASRIALGLEIRGRDSDLSGAPRELESLECEMATLTRELKAIVQQG